MIAATKYNNNKPRNVIHSIKHQQYKLGLSILIMICSGVVG